MDPRHVDGFVIVASHRHGLGLNVVVGYAGLLDLGYVAFYAGGAYVAGWFASQQFGAGNRSFGSTAASCPGHAGDPHLAVVR